ncbi:MAG: hypothetical protein J2P22_05840 [Nocardioides sp.]|nr:hypothetical protein [Nocardioides sp.]
MSPIRGALHAAQLPDGPALRTACARLVVPADAVVTDRTAAWLLMAPMALAPGDHLRVPDVDLFLPRGRRLRRPTVRSGERTLLPHEIVNIDGLLVTSKLRTTCDLGMQLPRRHAFAAMCSMMKVADFSVDAIRRQADGRFTGYRWVTQLRSLTPYLDPRFQSPGECWLALAWHDELGLPSFVPQYEVAGPHGPCYLDLAVPALRYAAEYDGPAWHGADQAAHDAERRDYLRDEGGWIIDVFSAEHVCGPSPRAGEMLREGVVRARRRMGLAAWSGQDRRG